MTEIVESNADAIIHISDAALSYIEKQVQKNQSSGMRISVKKAGCSGYQYVFDFVEKPLANDLLVFDKPGLHIYLDPKCVTYLVGATLDFVKQGMNAKLSFSNPNENGSCGCGESFYLE